MKFQIFLANAYFLGAASSRADPRVLRSKVSGKGKGGKGSIGDDDFVPPVVEEIIVPSGSNDDSHLERICSLYADFGAQRGDCQEFKGLLHLMCPDDYEVQKICGATGGAVKLEDAIASEFCFKTFENTLATGGNATCDELCTDFVVESSFCAVSCLP